MRQEFIIDGRNFKDLSGFYNEVEKVFTFNLSFKMGRNLNAFNDILRGGFGRHQYGEAILIKWLHYEKNKKELGIECINAIEDIIIDKNNSGHDCILEKL